MLWEVVARFVDYNGDRAETRQTFDVAGSVQELVTSIAAWSAAIENLSNARLIGGEARSSIQTTSPGPAAVSSNVYRRLLCLCRNGDDYASITIPSPSGLPYETAGPYRNFRIPPLQAQQEPRIAALQDLLSRCVTRYGKPFPSVEIMVALLENQNA